MTTYEFSRLRDREPASHDCAICGKLIASGENYRNDGNGRRAHLACVDLLPLHPVDQGASQ